MPENTIEQMQVAPSGIVIEFESYGSALIKRLEPMNVHPLQLLALCGLLEVEAKSALAEQREANKIAIPKPKIQIPGK